MASGNEAAYIIGAVPVKMSLLDRLRSFVRAIRRGLSLGFAEFRKASAETSDDISRIINGDGGGDPPAAA